MIRFVYPNVRLQRDGSQEFLRCGRYLTTSPDDPIVQEEDEDGRKVYDEANPNVGGIAKIHTAASILAKSSSETNQIVFERKDHPDAGISGYSLGLAYLLALLRRGRQLIWEYEELSCDIWCTGTVGEIIEGSPYLSDVSRNQFDTKIEAFLQELDDRLFIVPLANLTQEHKRQSESYNTRVLTLAQFQAIPVKDHFTQKTVLQLNGHELKPFVEFIFNISATEQAELPSLKGKIMQNLRDFTVQIRHPKTHIIAGAGIVVSTEGKILTCANVVEEASGISLEQAEEIKVGIYFPQVSDVDLKEQRAKVVAYLPQYDDDIVLLQLLEEECPLLDEQVAVVGKAEHSKGNFFETYGYLSGNEAAVLRADGKIEGRLETLRARHQLSESILLHTTTQEAQTLNGAAVLDCERNLVVGLIAKSYIPQQLQKRDCAYAVNMEVLSREEFQTFGISVQDTPHSKRSVPKPESHEYKAIEGRLEPAWNHAPAQLETWVGREDLLKQISTDWANPEYRVTGLIGFGGEGKSSLARKAIDEILSSSLAESKEGTPPRPDGIFWWGFYSKPNIDEFFEAALRYVSRGEIDPIKLPSASERAKVIGAMFNSRRYLFILDGLEPMQYQEGDRYGLLKSIDLSAFLSYFSAEDSQSFCLLTSRVPLHDLLPYSSYTHRDVTNLSQKDGVSLLQEIGVQGDEHKLEQVVENWSCHALTLRLLGAYLVEQCDGDVGKVDKIPSPTADEPGYLRVSRMLQWYERSLDEIECAFLMIFSLFRTPIDKRAFTHVFQTKGKTDTSLLLDSIVSLSPVMFRAMVNRFVSYHLLEYNPVFDHYTVHPLISEYYKKRLDASYSVQIHAIHQHIEEYYLAISGEIPETPTLEILVPLIEAVHHACRAGNYDDALPIFKQQLNQGRFLLPDVLGAWETYLMVLREFLSDEKTAPEPPLSTPRDKNWVLHEIGFCYMMSGRLHEAIDLYERSLDLKLRLNDLRDAGQTYSNLSETYAHLGRLQQSKDAALKELEVVNEAQKTQPDERNDEQEIIALADQAKVLYLQGQNESAGILFRNAEAKQQEIDPQIKYLYNLEGIKHADYLRRLGDNAYARLVAEHNLKICEKQGPPIYVSWNYRILGDLNAAQNQHKTAADCYDKALEIARTIECRELLLEVLISRGRWAARHAPSNLSSALDGLSEALGYANQSDYRIYEVDTLIAMAWAHIAEASPDHIIPRVKNEALLKAWQKADRAQRMSEKMGYYWGQKDAEEVMTKLAEIES